MGFDIIPAMLSLSSDSSSRLLHALFPAIAIHRQGLIVDASEAFEGMFGYTAGELAGMKITELIPAESITESDPEATDDNVPYETVGIHRSGSSVSMEAVSMNTAHEANPARITAVRDIRRRRRFEKSLRHAQKLEAIGQLAAGIAHEINNPLTYIVLHLESLIEDIKRMAPVEEGGSSMTGRLEEALDGAERVQRLVKDINAFARVDDEEAGTADLGKVIASSRKMAENVIKSRARLVIDAAEERHVRGQEGRLTQVILNLLINAAHAIEEGRESENEIRVRIGSESGHDGQDCVVIEVSDTGKGIPDHLRSRIFDPFFTTKPTGLGTGLGLSICRSIIESYGGSIELGPPRERGTAFIVKLPVALPEEISAPYNDDLVRTPARRRRILLMDDETGIGDAIRRVLSRDHDLVYLEDARRGLALIESGEKFDIILCDLMMPDFTGMDFYEAVLKRTPAVAGSIVFMTGGETTPKTAEFLKSMSNRRLSKPFRSQALRDLVK